MSDAGDANLRGTWDDPAIQTDPRISLDDPGIRRAAEYLHNNESMHMHWYVDSTICPYCALRASRVARVLADLDRRSAPSMADVVASATTSLGAAPTGGEE